MRYINLVYCKHHPTDRRAYLYSAPLELDVAEGQKLCVKDRHGEHIVTAFCENWLCSEKMTRVLCEANGGYFPPAEVVGILDTVTIRQEMVNYFGGDKTVIKEGEAEPWEF